jgi:hypothetical protein
MKQLIASAAIVLFAGPAVFAAEQTWTGKISDSKCGLSHKAMQHGDKKMTDRKCTGACVKGGAKYVFESNGKVYTIENQNEPDLVARAGRRVTLTGEMKGDSITVSKIQARAKKSRKS